MFFNKPKLLIPSSVKNSVVIFTAQLTTITRAYSDGKLVSSLLKPELFFLLHINLNYVIGWRSGSDCNSYFSKHGKQNATN